MREITINGLTPDQVELLDTMWEIDSFEDFEEWRAALDSFTKQQVDLLQNLVILENMEELLTDTNDAAEVIARIQSKLT